MQNESIRQTLLLWVVYTKLSKDNITDNDKIEATLKKVDKYLLMAGVTQVEIIFEILNFCTIKYLLKNTPKTVQFSLKELKRAGYLDIDRKQD